MEKNDGVVPALEKVHKSTHFNPATNEWISPESKVIHVRKQLLYCVLVFAKLLELGYIERA